jgi:hypothetical protein
MRTVVDQNLKQKKFIRGSAGAALLIASMVMLSISFIVLAGFGYSFIKTTASQKGELNSEKSYYYAEGALEDIVIRAKNNKKMPLSNPSTIAYSDGSVSVLRGTEIGGAMPITATGNTGNSIRKVTVTRAISTKESNFIYGIQVGEGGLVLGNSEVEGSVFSNGSATGVNGANVTGDLFVASSTHSITNIDVGGVARANTVTDSTITGALYCQSGSGNNKACDTSQADRTPLPFPINDETIDEWKGHAVAGGVINGDYNLSGTISFGPKKIIGNLTFSNNTVLTITGTIYVTGTITLANSSIVKLSSSYGSYSGVLLADGLITVGNIEIQGSGQEGSYLMVTSTKTDDAIAVNNSAEAAIFFAPKGTLAVGNIHVHEATGYRITVANSGSVEYESGLATVEFSSGPSGGFLVTGWREIE